MPENPASILKEVREREQRREKPPEPAGAVQPPQINRQPQRVEPPPVFGLREPRKERQEDKGWWRERAQQIKGKLEDGWEGAQEAAAAVKNKYNELNPPPSEEEKEKRRKKRIRNLAWVDAIGVGIEAAVIARRSGLKKANQQQAQITPTPEGIFGGGDTPEDRSANYRQMTLGRVGFGSSGYSLDIKDPPMFINKDFVEMAAKFGVGFLLPSGYDNDGNKTGEVSEAVVNNWANVLNLEPAEVRQNYVAWRNNPQEFVAILQQHGASQTVVNFLSKADELKKNDATPETWLDRNTELQQWWQQNSAAIGKTEAKKGISSVAKVRWEKEVRIQTAGKFNEIAGRVNMETMGAVNQMLGSMETLINMPINTTAMHEAAAVDVAEFYQQGLQKPPLANTGIPFVLTGLILLRAGPSWPKAVIAEASQRLENVYYWMKLGQAERAIRDLAVLGKQVWQRVARRKN